jgi:hypothetical protein
MDGFESLKACHGRWHGLYRLYLTPNDPVQESGTTAVVSPAAKSRLARLDYTWVVDGQEQEGSLLVGFETGLGQVSAAWIDSWHNGERMMICQGGLTGQGVEFTGSYPAPSGPDWGWRTVLAASPGRELRMTMYNLTPDGQAFLAVEAVYHPQV